MCNSCGKMAIPIAGRFINVTGSTIPDNEHYGRLCNNCMGKGCKKCHYEGWFQNKINYLIQNEKEAI